MRSLPDWPEYLISPEGGVYRITTRGGKPQLPKRLTPWTTLAGYHQVYFSRAQIRKVVSVHRIVAEAYLPNPLNLAQVNHIDGNPINNEVSNLEWCSPQHNMQHAKTAGSFKDKGDMKLMDRDVIALRARRRNGATLQLLAKDFGVSIRYVQQLMGNTHRKDSNETVRRHPTSSHKDPSSS